MGIDATATKPKRDRLAHVVHICLLTGLVASAALLLIGLIVAVGGGEPRPEGLVTDPRVLLPQAAKGSGVAMLQLGLWLLLFTPVSRVVVLAVGWGARREWSFAATAVVVLCLLAASIMLGAH